MTEAAPEGYLASKNCIQRYQLMISSLMWPATQTRPDIAYVTGLLARYLVNPIEKHVAAAKRVF